MRTISNFKASVRCALFAISAVCGAGADVLFETHTTFGPDITRHVQRYHLLSWEADNSLPHSDVTAVVRARDGHLWVGTEKGLARFDGVEMAAFNKRNSPQMTDDSITALLDGPDGSLWIGTRQGGVLRMREGQFRNATPDDGMRGTRIRALRAGPDGSIWIAREDGIDRFKDGRFTRHTFENEATGDTVVMSIHVDAMGAAWVGTSNGIRVIRDGIVTIDRDHEVRRTNHEIQVIYQDRAGSRWTATKYELIFENGESFARFDAGSGLDSKLVECIYEDSHGTLWFGTKAGLYRFERGRFVLELANGSLSNDGIMAIDEDHEGNLWLVTNNGLRQLRAAVFSAYTTNDGLPHKFVTTVCEDEAGALWIGTWGGGLLRWMDTVKTHYTTTQKAKFNRVQALHPTRDGSILVGFDTSRVIRIGDGILSVYRTPHGDGSRYPNVIQQDSTGTLWTGTEAGIVRLEQEIFVLDNAPGAPRKIRAITEDRDGVLWVGTSSGLTRYVDGKLKPTSQPLLQGVSVNALYADGDGVLWIATESSGILWLKNGIVNACTTSRGLLSDEVVTIVGDDHGFLWMTSRRGIFRVAKQELDQLTTGARAQVACVLYGKDDGVTAIDANNAVNPAAWKSRDGRLWFATPNGLLVADPATLRLNEIAPPPVVTQFNVDGNKLPLNETAQLPPGRGTLQFHYTALSFAQPEKIKFKYRLEGVDADWVDAGSRRVAYYNGVTPGHYRFEVMARNNDGIWSTSAAAFGFRLAPHFYQTWWFYGLLGVLAGGSAYGTHILRVRSLRQREQELNSLVRERTAELVEAQRELIDISRQAGMAEVATGVLHNVGNVLNSVNVSATLVVDHVRGSKAANLPKLGAMLQAHSGDLANFLTNDARGQRIPGYLIALASELATERETVCAELDHLRKNIEHIKDIVAMQQSYATISGMTETVAIADLVDDALRMNASALARHGLEVIRDYTIKPIMTVDRHKVLQILVNVIRNAKYACDDSGRLEKQVTVRIAQAGDRVQIAVTDNGVGIPAENLTRIFAHGFTTRKNGHGFGLHSGALAAKELGGSLHVHSDGPGCGATFTLELALNLPAAS